MEGESPVIIIRNAAATAKINVTKLRGDITVLEGSGGNITVYTGREGTVLVDAGITASRPQITEALASLSDDPVKHLINSHRHFDHTDSDNTNEVIETAVEKLNFVMRDIARGRLKKLNPAYRQVAVTSSPNEISVAVDNQPPLQTPAKGAPVAWVGPDGGKVNASMQLTGRLLAQTFTSADGRRVNDYTLSPDGRTLTMQVTETSPGLSQTITYKQVYRRVS